MNYYVETYVRPYLKKYSALMIMTIILGALALLSAAALTYTSGYLITRASEKPETILLVYVPIVMVRAFGISRSVLRYIENLLGHDAVLKVLADMRLSLYRALEPQALFIRSKFKTGDLLGALSDDIEHLQDVYIRTIFPTMIGLFIFIFAVIWLAVFDWVFAIFMFLAMSVVVFVYPVISLYILKRQQTISKEQHTHLYETYTDAILGVSDWIISGRKEEFVDTFLQDAKESDASERKLDYWHQTRMLQLQLYTGVLVVIVGIWAGFQALDGNIAPTYIAAFTLVVMPILEGMIPISHAVERIPVYEESFRRLDAIETFKPVDQDRATVDPSFENPDISIDNVSYRYTAEGNEAVKDVTLHIPYGEKIAVLGKSGAGKSTLIQLLLGNLHPTAGTIRIDGQDPTQYGDGIYESVSVLNQKPYLFATSVENNIRLGNHNVPRERIEEIVDAVGLGQYISTLPKKLDTQMEETGQRFSGGERQRIALSRILVKDTPIVVLDEPTIGLDPDTEYDLVDTMLEALEEKTVIWITHHLTGIEKMDRVLFMDDGEIAILGTHEELLQTNERYRRLYELDRGL